MAIRINNIDQQVGLTTATQVPPALKSTEAAGSTPTKAEFDALRADVERLWASVASMADSIITSRLADAGPTVNTVEPVAGLTGGEPITVSGFYLGTVTEVAILSQTGYVTAAVIYDADQGQLTFTAPELEAGSYPLVVRYLSAGSVSETGDTMLTYTA